MLDKFK